MKEIKIEETPPCPAIRCGGEIVSRRSRFGKIFYSCSNFPDCDVIINDLSQLQEKYPNHPKIAYQKKKGAAKGGGKGVRGKLTPSKELAAVIGSDPVTRGEAIKKVWEHIMAQDLQDPNDKRQIIPDDKLATVFGTKESVSMFRIAGFFSKHLG